MNEYLDSLERLILLEETYYKQKDFIKKRQRVIEAGRFVFLEPEMYTSNFLSVEMIEEYEAYIESLISYSYEEVYERANRILAFHHFQVKKII